MGDVASNLPLCFDDVSVVAGETPILSGVSLAFEGGRPTVIMGPNGAGKSTLLRLAMGLITPTAGCIRYAGRSRPIAERMAIVFQKPVMLRRSAAENIAFALMAAAMPAGPGEVERLLDTVGLAGLGTRPARRLSGGEQQRLALARALARQPELLFLDEPTANLDPAATRMVEEIVGRIADAGVKTVIATHDLGQARRLAGDVALLVGGRLVERGPARAFFDTPSTEQARRFMAGDLVI